MLHKKNGSNKSMAIGILETNLNGLNKQTQSVERAKPSSANQSSALIEAYMVRKSHKISKLASDAPEMQTKVNEGKSTVKMVKKGNTFFPAIFKSPARNTTTKQNFTSQIFKMR